MSSSSSKATRAAAKIKLAVVKSVDVELPVAAVRSIPVLSL